MSDEQPVTAGEPPTPGEIVPLVRGEAPAEIIDHDTGEVVPANQSGIVFADALDDAAVASYMNDMDATTDDSPEAIQLEIARRILSADSEAALWAATTVLSAKDVQFQPLLVTGVRWIKSAHEGGAPKFAIIDAKKIAGDVPVTVSCGGLNVVLTLYKLQKFNSLPAKVVIESKPSGNDPGRVIYTMKPVAG